MDELLKEYESKMAQLRQNHGKYKNVVMQLEMEILKTQGAIEAIQRAKAQAEAKTAREAEDKEPIAFPSGD